MRSLLIISFGVFLSYGLVAQSSVRDLEQYLNKLRKSPYESVPETILSDSKNEARLLDMLNPYLSDTLNVVKQKAYYLTKRIGQKSKNTIVQTQAVSMLVRAFKDKDTGLQSSTIEAMTGFPRASFNKSSKDSISKAIQPAAAHLDELLKLAGYLDLREKIPAIQTLVQTSDNAHTKWAARIALARMGETNAVNYIVNKLSAAQINDDFVYDIVPDLIYTRQPAVFEYLETIINSDEQACQSANPDSNKKILCGYRVMENIAPYIQNFPIKTDDSGDLAVSDYRAALQTVRQWFAINTKYQILTDTF